MSELMEESMDSFIRHISQEHNSEYINPLPGNWRRDFLFVEKAAAESKKLWQSRKSCGIIWMLSYLHLATGGGVGMEVIITFLVAVAAGVACHYIIKWLDGDHKDNK